MAETTGVTLTQTAFWTRRTVKWGSITIASLLLLRITYSIGKQIYLAINPPPPPPPTVGFGVLPYPQFLPRQIKNQLAFKLETPEGALPALPDQTKVFYLPQPRSTFSALDQAKTTATALGFRDTPEEIDKDIVYRFTDPRTNQTLTMNIITGSFTFSRPWTTDQALITGQPQSQDAATKTVTAFLKKGELLPKDLETGPTTLNFYKAAPPRLEPVVSLSEANFVKVNLFRAPYNDLPVLSPSPDQALVSFTVGAGNTLIQGQYYHYTVLADRFETYPLKTSQTAWDELNAGNSFIAKITPNYEGEVKIRKVYLAYYDSKDIQEYLQPIIVFEGDHDFVAYVPAITSEYLKAQ